MKLIKKFWMAGLLLAGFGYFQLNAQSMMDSQSIHKFTMNSLMGDPVDLSGYQGKVLMVVNTASECGLTPQYEQLESMHQEYGEKGLVILGFPANNFGQQEPGTDKEIAQFCQKNYGVSFPMFSKISVKGDDMHPLYQFLTRKSENGVQDSEVQWNFQKYLIDQDGHLVAVLSPRTLPDDPEVKAKIQELLAR